MFTFQTVILLLTLFLTLTDKYSTLNLYVKNMWKQGEITTNFHIKGLHFKPWISAYII